jgi:ribose/xylose/arabinose/galactoside ABC-type transport system permease subunit/ABC-type multidrug transport system ATPase subunit
MTRAGAILRDRAARVPGEASSRLGLAALAVALVALFSLLDGGYFSTANGLTIALNMSAIAIVVIGSAALLISGNVDLSIGGMYALLTVSVGQVASTTGSTALALLAGPILGALLGAANGVLVRTMRISPLIVTVGTMTVFAGFAYVVSGGVPVFGFPADFVAFGRWGIGDLTTPIIVAAVVFLIGSFLLVRTRAGLRVYAIGGDERAAGLNGVPVRKIVIGLYALNGCLVGVAAVLVAARLGSVSPTFGADFEFDVLTAAILGGVAFAGGSGRPLGIFIGVAVIGILNAGLIFQGLPDYWQQVAKGTVLLLALGADQLVERVRESGGWRAWLMERRGRAVARVGASRAVRAAAAPPAERLGALRRGDRPLGPVVLEAEGLTRHYGAVTALAGAGVRVRAGEVVCLLGDNGAGKSTLIKLLSGAVRPDAGTIRIAGAPRELHSPRDARAAGIETVYQDLALCPPLSVAHNFVLGDEPVTRLLGVLPVRDDAAAERLARARLEQLGIGLADYRTPVKQLSGGQRQAVAIARALHEGVRVVILDEPTAALGVAQTRGVLELVRHVADRGTGVLLITHDIETVMAIADTVVVLRLGAVAHAGPLDELDELAILHLMAGAAPAPERSEV